MAIAGMTPGYQDGIRAHFKGFYQKIKIDTAGAGKPHNPDISGILEPVGSGEIRSQISAPVADIGDNFRFKLACFAHRVGWLSIRTSIL
jgi:hypothetical protein